MSTLERSTARWLAVSVAAAALASFSVPAHSGAISPAGTKLAAVIDAMDVEHHWPAGVHVSWQTGDPDGREETSPGKHTHCSAFVAATAKRLDVYVLRPPEHKQILLANAQYDWLAGEGAAQGWRPVAGAIEAQAAANAGELVVATYKNPHDDKPGHIAIVRPSDKSDAQIRSEGPQIAQAGAENYASTSLKVGFSGHPAAWRDAAVRYYAHAITLP